MKSSTIDGFEQSYHDVNGVRLSVHTGGQGAPLLCYMVTHKPTPHGVRLPLSLLRISPVLYLICRVMDKVPFLKQMHSTHLILNE